MIRKFLLIFFLVYSPMMLAREHIVSLTGKGTLDAMPDLIRISIEISKIDKNDAAKAKVYVDTLSSRAAEALISIGIKEADITSSSLKVETANKYDDHDNPTPSGFSASRVIDIVIRDVSSYSRVVQKLVDTGITEISDVKPDISDREEL